MQSKEPMLPSRICQAWNKGQALEAELDRQRESKPKAIALMHLISPRLKNLINDVIADFGSLDILINNAGITQDTLACFA